MKKFLIALLACLLVVGMFGMAALADEPYDPNDKDNLSQEKTENDTDAGDGTNSTNPAESNYCQHNGAHHTVTVVNGKNPCTSTTTTFEVCDLCDTEIPGTAVTTPAPGHVTTGEQKIIKPATCNTPGVVQEYCIVCGEWIELANKTVAPGHRWSTPTVVTPATCIQDGVTKKFCLDCEHIEVDVIKATGKHTFNMKLNSTYVENKANCVENGNYTAICLTCQTRFSKADGNYTGSASDGTNVLTIPARGHKFGDGVITKTATCLEDGIVEYVCQNTNSTLEYDPCGGSYENALHQVVTMPADYEVFDERVQQKISKWHQLVEVVEKQPTATEKGIHKYYCKVCGWTSEEMVFSGTASSGTKPSGSSSSSNGGSKPSTGKKGVTIPATNDTTSSVPYVLIAVAFVGLVAMIASKKRVHG